MRLLSCISLALPVIGLLGCSAAAQTEAEQARFDTLVEQFQTATIIGTPSIEDCVLSEGAEARCMKVTVLASPANHITGPFCPRTITDTDDDGGKWFVDGELRDVDGDFIKNLAEIFGNDNWQMYDPETGRVYLTAGVYGCAGAGAPEGLPEGYTASEVGPGYSNPVNSDDAAQPTNTCVECEMGYIGANVTHTYFIPLTPVAAERVPDRLDPRTGIGLSLNGVKMDASAPLDLIQGGYTLGPLDNCGGHINPIEGYHYHGVVEDCAPRLGAEGGHAAVIGVAMDGHEIYDRLDADGLEPADLDQCRGHTTEGLGYHYHVSDAGTNAILPCITAQTGCSSDSADGKCDASATARPPRP